MCHTSATREFIDPAQGAIYVFYQYMLLYLLFCLAYKHLHLQKLQISLMLLVSNLLHFLLDIVSPNKKEVQ